MGMREKHTVFIAFRLNLLRNNDIFLKKNLVPILVEQLIDEIEFLTL